MKNKYEELNQNTIIILLSSILFLIILIFISSINLYNKNIKSDATELNKIIESDTKKDGKKAYLVIKSISQIFARNKETKNGYYIVSDGNYNYVVCLDDNSARKLFKKDLDEDKTKIYGITKKASNSIKELAVENYNRGYEKEEQISINDYYSYFGDVYLDNISVK